ncbi:DUF817 domain-containing protein [Thalassorhabdomicrobium marinisediminis]|uniref:DUF817 domain-containing protein n=1 Tax=Thalassorhabdomicrobium marinisediminis TaxID=2170577 RepID=A0A2T7FXA6_9RHOB|nr:DUF817 domain-containing protein [Thalassorhabdomicrobium marinisediminis]PVA06796.1 DUF817 domain-containing protein [Thalassorhabdomicrobium marinisediminis]
MDTVQSFETAVGAPLRRALPAPLAEAAVFVLKTLWACLFGALILLAVITTKAVWNADWPVARYDALFVFALGLQAVMLLFRLETRAEAKVILLFHLTGTGMEWFKVNVGSWTYPEEAIFMVWNVPLFSGFMYASVGSFIARVIRLFDMRFTPYPPFWTTAVLAVAIYANFFAHHYWYDLRWLLFAATLLLFARTRVVFHLSRRYWMPLPLAALGASGMLYIAENVGTLTGTWVYAGAALFDWTPPSKMGSWYLLLFVAFVTVTCVVRAPLDIRRSRATTDR